MVSVFAAAAIALATSVLTEGDGEGSFVAWSLGCSSTPGVADGFGREGVAEAFARSVFFGLGVGVAFGRGFGDRFGAAVGAAVAVGVGVTLGVGLAAMISLCTAAVNALSACSSGGLESSGATGGGGMSLIAAAAGCSGPKPPSIQTMFGGGVFAGMPPQRTTAESATT